MTYHPKIKKLGKLIKDLLQFLYSVEEVLKSFPASSKGLIEKR